jgi:hypothetical protein
MEVGVLCLHSCPLPGLRLHENTTHAGKKGRSVAKASCSAPNKAGRGLHILLHGGVICRITGKNIARTGSNGAPFALFLQQRSG